MRESAHVTHVLQLGYLIIALLPLYLALPCQLYVPLVELTGFGILVYPITDVALKPKDPWLCGLSKAFRVRAFAIVCA